MSVSNRRKVRVLAVGDPAVYTYTSSEHSIVDQWSRETGVELDFSILAWSDYYSKLMNSLQSDNSEYDIVMIPGHLWLDDFVARGYLKPLDDYVDSLSKEYDYNDLLPSVRKELVSNGSTYLVPSFTDGHILFYRKDRVIEATGAELPEVINIRDYAAVIKKVADRFQVEDSVALKAHESEIFLDWLPWLRGMGGSVFDDKMNPVVNSSFAVKALEAYLDSRKYASKDSSLYGNDEIKDAIRTGKVSMAVSWGGQAGFIMADDFEGKDEIRFATFDSPWNVTWSFAVPATAKLGTEVKDFLAFISSQEVDRIVGSQAGSPVRSSNYKLDSDLYPWYGVQKKMTELSKPLPGFRGSSEVYSILYNQLSRAFTGNIGAREVLDEAAFLMKSKQAEFNSILV